MSRKRGKEGQKPLSLGFDAHEDGHFVIRDAGLAQTNDLFGQFLLYIVRFADGIDSGIALFGVGLLGLGENMDAHETTVVLRCLLHFLFSVKVGDGLRFVQSVFVEDLCRVNKKSVVETHNALATAIIGVEVVDLGVGVVAKLSEGVPISSAPTVNALLDIAHYHAAVAGRCGFAKEVTEVFPLKVGGVLKLVDHDVPEVRAGALKDEGDFVRAHELVKKQRGVGQHEGIAFSIECTDFAIDVVEQAERVELLQAQLARIDRFQLVVYALAESGKIFCETFYPSVARPFVFLIEFGNGIRYELVDGVGFDLIHRTGFSKVPINIFFQEALERVFPSAEFCVSIIIKDIRVE